MFGSSFFTLTGFHGAHVTIGVIWLLSLLFVSLRGGLSQRQALDVEIAGLYWHFVDIVWIVIFTLVYLIPYDGGRRRRRGECRPRLQLARLRLPGNAGLHVDVRRETEKRRRSTVRSHVVVSALRFSLLTSHVSRLTSLMGGHDGRD